MDLLGVSALLLTLIQIVWSTGRIEVKFSRYINHGGSGINGHCCDGRGIFCFSHCDHRFIICLDKATGSKSLRECFYGKKSSRDIPNQNTINFGRSIGGIPNPMVYTFKSWPGDAALKVDVYDVDDNEDDKVDFLYGKFSAEAEPSKAASKERNKRLSTSRTLLDYRIRVYCDKDYFGPKCETYCEPQDDTRGHYTCDAATGQKICREGWFGENCDKNNVNECDQTPPPCNESQICNNTESGYICTCPEGFFGEFCNLTSSSTSCDSALCLNNGTCVSDSTGVGCNCMEEWVGEFCEIQRSEVDPCFNNPCKNDGNCVKLQNGYECECPEVTQGHHCENTSVCHTGENPCANGGECVRLNGTDGWYECLCEAGFSGVHCDQPLGQTDTTTPGGDTTTGELSSLRERETTTATTTEQPSETEVTSESSNVYTSPTEDQTTTEKARKVTTEKPAVVTTKRSAKPKPSDLDHSTAIIFLRGKIQKSDQDLKKSFARMIRDLLGLKGKVEVTLETETFINTKGDIISHVNVSATENGKPLNLAKLQALFVDPHSAVPREYLPVPVYHGDHEHPHPHPPKVKSKAEQLQELHETSWIHKHWYVVLVAALALVIFVIILAGIVIHRRRKTLGDEEKSAASNLPASSGGVSDVTPQSFENSLYFEMNQTRQNNSLPGGTFSKNIT